MAPARTGRHPARLVARPPVTADHLSDAGRGRVSLPSAPAGAAAASHPLSPPGGPAARLREQYAPATVNLVLSAVRGVVRAAFADGAISAADYLRLKMVKGVEAHRQPSGRSLDAGEAAALFRACTAERTPSGTRDAAAFALMYGAGLRRAEAAALDLADYNRETGALRVIGKGDKERTAYVGKGGMDAFTDWLEMRGDDPGPFLVPVDHVGRLTVRRITPRALMCRLRRRTAQAGIAP